MSAPEVVVEVRDVSIEFPGVKALQNVGLSLRAGEVHSLMGENGAGKSTLIKALTGVYAVDSGTIVVLGVERDFNGTADAQAAGISTVYQEVNLCINLTVGENVMLGHEKRGFWGINWSATHDAAAQHLRRLNLDIDPRSPLASHSLAVQQLIAISRAMVINSSVLILDEPTSSLDQSEVEKLFDVMRALKAEGVAILFVSHFLDQVYEISDRLTVLRNGELVGEYVPAELDRLGLVAKMLGREFSELESLGEQVAHERRPRETDPVLAVSALTRKGSVEPADLALFSGEVVGLAGLLGSGRTELARTIYGADRADSGRTFVNGEPVRLATPRDSVDQRIAFSSEDRRAEGIVGDLTIRENIALGVQAKRGWARPMTRQAQDELALKYIAALNIRPADPEALIRNLSGGNQQKVLLARWLATAPQVLILDEPTRGIDVGAKAEIQRLITELAADGMAVLFISSELDEVVRLSQRICVLRDHKIVAEITNREGINVDDIVALIAIGGGE
ncbi:sugar ABC transporter ATP-binding protein [Subtercola frigoramans]|uniref:Simple sugar transport system ATP-binding protein n=1 Tax=Subtercola frigoramans TaxID=120298 RepID=A0ABS2L0S5_9MICO|nr:sugar ABC transporter ATP-binding protein [Subtercola frigoramans]MBM7470669.1 simple sugar transport system ATP-binding protein [Subtercola frigoramans]